LSVQPIDRSYFGQSLVAAIPNLEELLIEPQGIDALRRDGDRWIEQRNRFLDLLLSLYAEDVPADIPAACSGGELHGEELVETKLALLGKLAEVTRIRGRGFDYLAEASARNVAGLEIKSRLQLNIKPADAPMRKLYVVEHLLLRSAKQLRGAGFDYAFKVSAVIHVSDAQGKDQGKDPGFRRRAAAVLRANTPAHIAVLPRFLNAEQLRDFEALYKDWCDALRSRDPWGIVRRSVQLRDFLAQYPPEQDIALPDGGAPS
jgi:hypothetical protein